MSRYLRILDATFDDIVLPLPLSARLSRQAQPLATAGDADAFVSNVQLSKPVISLELQIRDTAVAEGLYLGQAGLLEMTIGSSKTGKPARCIALAGAVLHAVELEYLQNGFAKATLRFTAAAPHPSQDPFSAEDSL